MIDAADPASGVPASRPDIDLGPLFAPRSIAIVGASPRSDLTPTILNNLTVMGSGTRCHLVNPNYTEAWGRPSWTCCSGRARPATYRSAARAKPLDVTSAW